MIEQFSQVHTNPSGVYTHREYALDSNVTSIVLNLPTPNRRYFAIEKAHIFREQFQRRNRMFVLVERRGTDRPEWRQVRCVDGSVLVLASPLNFDPEPGACVQLLVGFVHKFIDERTAEKTEKQEIRWI